MQGSIRVVSHPGQGSCFEVRLPILGPEETGILGKTSKKPVPARKKDPGQGNEGPREAIRYS
jgi:hypothetical protein